MGNICDLVNGLLDTDGDGIEDARDNCPTIPNPMRNLDACAPDSDFDGDGVRFDDDNCPLVDNPGQADANVNDQGDACENDRDGDGFIDETPVGGMPMTPPDNCKGIANPMQQDSNFDGTGDDCTVPVQ